MSTSMSVLFYARKSMANNQGEYPIYMRITIAGERFEIGTKRFILPENWSAETGRMKGASSNARSVNTFLESLLSKAYTHQRQILNEGKEFTMTEFRSRWTGVPLEKPRMLLEVFEEHNQQMKALIGRDFSHHTFERYTTSKKHTQEFMKWKYKVEDIDIRKLNYEFITNYESMSFT
jgi:hypothetical protein